MTPEPLEPELRELLARARTPEPVPVPAQSRLWERLAQVAPMGPIKPSLARRLAAHPWTVSAVSAGVGAAAGAASTAAVLRRSAPLPPPARVAPAPLPPVALPLPDVPPHVLAPPPPVPPRRPQREVHAPAAAAPPPAPVSDASLAKERSLVDQARSALARGKPEAALAALAEHEATFPDGELAAEREALRVLALVQAGDAARARAAAQSFEARFPLSLLRSVVRDAILQLEASPK